MFSFSKAPVQRKYLTATRSANSESEPSILDTEYNQLLIAFRKFEERLSPELRTNFNQRPPNMDDIVNAVRTAELKWTNTKDESMWRVPKKYFHKFCGTLNSHSAMLLMIPAQNQYLSILYGSLLSVINVRSFVTDMQSSLTNTLNRLRQITRRSWKACPNA